MKFFRFEQIPCFCFRRGKRLKDHEIKALVENLSRYIPPIDVEEVVLGLEKRGFYRSIREDVAILEESLREFNTSGFLAKKFISRLKDSEFCGGISSNPLARFV